MYVITYVTVHIIKKILAFVCLTGYIYINQNVTVRYYYYAHYHSH